MVRVWTNFTGVAPERQGTSIFLSLEDEPLDAALELREDEISSKGTVKIIIARLDKLYKKDDALFKFLALEAFEMY